MNIKSQLNIAAAQFDPILGDVEHNKTQITNLMQQAKGNDLVVFPELANTGYNFTSASQAFELSEEISNSSFVEFLVDEASNNKCSLIAGFCERVNDKLYNSTVFVDASGIKGHYRKVHLFMNEKDIFEYGNLGFPVFDFYDYKLGMLICFDYMIPECSRVLGLKGADIICHPSNIVTLYGQKVVPALALMNSVYFVTTNRVGIDNGLRFNGNSMIVDPRGEILARASETEAEVISCSIIPEKARDKWVTKRNHVIDDRHPDLYTDLIK
ncbi:MAG: nitrilase-related carbon-nitrogen hydrolase [Hyphomicrobiales bacterium]